MNRLLEIGFQSVGKWLLTDDKLTFELDRHASERNILYAFVIDGEVKYVGKTVQTLRARMHGYKNPEASQTTNVRNNARIKAQLQTGAAVVILALPDSLLHFGTFHINLAAGLEDDIILKLKPEWNGKTAIPVAEPLSPTQQASPDSFVSFPLVLQPTYFSRGFFNVGVDRADRFGADGQTIEIFCGNADQPILGIINRSANSNHTPRIMGGKGLRDWFRKETSAMQEVLISVLSPTAIRIKPGGG